MDAVNNMRKTLFSLILLFVFGLMATAQEKSGLMIKLSEMEGVEYHQFNRTSLDSIVSEKLKGYPVRDMAYNIKPNFINNFEVVEIAELDDPDTEIIEEFLAEFSKFKNQGLYETLVSINEGESNIEVLGQRDKDVITEFIILVVGEDDARVIKITGQFAESDIEDIIKQKSNS